MFNGEKTEKHKECFAANERKERKCGNYPQTSKKQKKQKMFCNVTKLTNTCELSTSKMCIGTTWYRKCAIK